MTRQDIPYETMEDIYDLMARAMDDVGERHERAFFSKLVLTLAHMLGDRSRVAEAIEIAKQDLDG